MKLSPARFYKTNTLHKGADGRVREAIVYSYETHKALYDLYVIEGMLFTRTNCGPMSAFISSWTPIHYKIEAHFELEKAGPAQKN